MNIKDCYSKSDVCRKMGWPTNGTGMRKVSKLIESKNLDTSHFDIHKSRRKYDIIEKKCPVCGNKFETRKGTKREKQTCSCACSNTYFRSGIDNPNYKGGSRNYRTTCFHYHDKKCIICGEDKIVEVHHFDGNRDNNFPENLVPLCPNHHQYIHSRYKNLIFKKIKEYRDKFILSKKTCQKH